jgi:hypothetical protein
VDYTAQGQTVGLRRLRNSETCSPRSLLIWGWQIKTPGLEASEVAANVCGSLLPLSLVARDRGGANHRAATNERRREPEIDFLTFVSVGRSLGVAGDCRRGALDCMLAIPGLRRHR